MTKKKIYIYGSSGQLGNQLFFFANVIAYALQHGFEVANPAFFNYAHWFEGTYQDIYCRFPTQKSSFATSRWARIIVLIFYKIVAKLGIFYRFELEEEQWLAMILAKLKLRKVPMQKRDKCFLDKKTFREDLFGAKKRELAEQNRFFINGFMFTAENLMAYHRPICDFFRPMPHIQAQVSATIAPLREKYDIIIGMHIRRNDYKTYKNGIYYYDDETFLRFMENMTHLLPHKKIVFLICSNEKLNKEKYAAFETAYPNGSPIIDISLFAACDYLIGPPSTFTQWASFYGSVPLLKMENKQLQFSLGDFAAYTI